jgi:eukaryotic-like serine/threonine-protein kinase
LESQAGRGKEGLLRPNSSLANRYIIQGVIGVGGMGAVYKARDMHFPNVVKLVAVKEMVNQARDALVRETIVRNFEREANLLATLSHAAIPRIYDYFSHDQKSYLILEFVNGKDLEDLLTESSGFFPEEKIIQWAIELCDVLHYLHSLSPEPIVFRDIKPSNVMINEHNHIILVDFGIAKHFQAGEKGTMIGTEGYSPPEQYRGEASALADIYALGATLHHLLTRKDPRLEPPFSFSERPIQAINPNVSDELVAIIHKALEYNSKDRFKSALEMKEALLNFAYPKASNMKTITPEASPEENAGEEKTIKPAWTFACEDEIRGTPVYENGIVYIGSYDHNLYALNATTGDFIWKYATEGGVVSRPATHDGDIFFGSEDYRLHVVSSRSGRVVWTYYTEGPVRSSPFIAHGHVFVGSDDGFLHAVNLLSGRQVWKTEAGSPIRSSPLVEDEAVYFGSESGDFYSVDYSGAIKWRFKAKRPITSSPAVDDGIIFFGSLDANFYAIEAKTGWVVWRFRLSKGTISSPFIAEGRVFTGAADGIIYCIDAHSGKEVWRFATDHQVTGSPIVHKDSLYCGSVDGNLYCLDSRSGRLRWKFLTEGAITGTPVAHEDFVYIGSTDRKIYAFLA